MLEGLISRGDEKIADVIEQAYRSGALLDSWDEYVRYDIWRTAIAGTVGDPSKYYAARDEKESLPWKIIDTGYERLLGIMGSRCAEDKNDDKPYTEKLDTALITDGFHKFTKRYEVKDRYRIIFEKKGRAKYISHLDFIECVKRGLRIIGAPVSFSQGFNKHERIGAGYPLTLGIESQSEIIDIETFAEMQFDLSSDQSVFFPEGIRIISMRSLDNKKSVMSETVAINFQIHCSDEIRSMIESAVNDGRVFEKKRKDGTVDQLEMKNAVMEMTSSEEGINLILPATGGIRVDSLIKQITGDERILAKCEIIKTGQLSKLDGILSLIQ
jgi:radical SAM-linked protein